MHREVNLTKRVQTPQGMRYCPVVLSANGRVKPDAVLVNGKPERHPEGAYYIEWHDNGRRRRLSVGKDAADASSMRLRKETELNNGDATVPEIAANGHRSVAGSVADYLEETELTKKPKTLAAYTTALTYFRESCPKLNLEDIDRMDLLKFCAFLRDKKKQAPRSVYNKFENVMSFLKANGIRGLVGKNDWPRYTEEEPEMYEQEELDKLFKACDGEERLWYEFFLMTGMREQEVMYTYWSDVNFAAATVRVSHKPDRGWTPKAYKEREIPIPAKLAQSLKAWKAKSDKTCSLVFPDSRMQSEARLPRLPESRCRACETRRRQLLAAQVPRYVRYSVSLGWSRSAHRAAVARSLGHGIDDAVSEAVTQPAGAGEGERDFRLKGYSAAVFDWLSASVALCRLISYNPHSPSGLLPVKPTNRE